MVDMEKVVSINSGDLLIMFDHQIEALNQIWTILIHLLNITFFYFTFRLSGSGKELQFGGRARYSKSPELIETTFSMSTIAEVGQQWWT